jgi:preprotein translocase subunit SecY
MGKVIRKSLPRELSIGLLLLIFILSFVLSGQIFASGSGNDGKNIYLGMVLVAIAVVTMVLILWEELLFPVKILNPEQGEVIFRNHRTKLKFQVLIYCTIPVIFAFIYLEYQLNLIRFIIWAGICIVIPAAAKLISGINNYNDFLKLTDDAIEYKNNKEVGTLEVKEIQHITLVKDERKVLHKIEVAMNDGKSVMIDLDEMELEAFYQTIDKYIWIHYKRLIK